MCWARQAYSASHCANSDSSTNPQIARQGAFFACRGRCKDLFEVIKHTTQRIPQAEGQMCGMQKATGDDGITKSESRPDDTRAYSRPAIPGRRIVDAPAEADTRSIRRQTLARLPPRSHRRSRAPLREPRQKGDALTAVRYNGRGAALNSPVQGATSGGGLPGVGGVSIGADKPLSTLR